MNTCSYKGEHMWINKSTAKVLQVFTGHITESFTLREVARMLKMHVSLAHRAIKPLIEKNIILQGKHNGCYAFATHVNMSENSPLPHFRKYSRRITSSYVHHAGSGTTRRPLRTGSSIPV